MSNFASDTIAVGEEFQFTIGTSLVQLPSNTAETGTFAIETQLSGNLVDSISTLTWSGTTEGTLGLPSTITDAVSPTSEVIYTSTTYTFSLFPPNSIEQDAEIYVTFPSEISLPTSTT